jgi:hypothetical protein
MQEGMPALKVGEPSHVLSGVILSLAAFLSIETNQRRGEGFAAFLFVLA